MTEKRDESLIAAFGTIANEQVGRTKNPYFKKNTQGVCTISQFYSKTVSLGASLFVQAVIDTSTPTAPNAEVALPGVKVENAFWVNHSAPKNKMMAKKDAKRFLLAALGAQEADVSPEDFNQTLSDALSSEQPLRGVKVLYSVGDNGFPKFFAAPAQKAEEVSARRAELDKTHPLI